MYKKQLTLITIIYIAVLLMFTACTVVEDDRATAVEAVIPVAKADEQLSSKIDTPQQPADPEPEPANMSADDNAAGNNMSSGNSMSGGNMMGDRAEEVPSITQLPNEDIDTNQERDALELLVKETSIARLLAKTPDWHVEMWTNDEEQTMEIDLFNADWGWIAWGNVALTSNGRPESVVEVYAPKQLTAAEEQSQRAAAEALVLADGAVLEILGDPNAWEMYSWYDEWEGAWDVNFNKGLDEIGVRVDNYDGEFMVGEISNLALLDEEQQISDNQNQAIELAWQAEGIDEALFGGDEDEEWQTFVTHLGGSEYGVSFASADKELFFAAVDIAAGQVLD